MAILYCLFAVPLALFLFLYLWGLAEAVGDELGAAIRNAMDGWHL
jgi:hypothetical protein